MFLTIPFTGVDTHIGLKCTRVKVGKKCASLLLEFESQKLDLVRI